MSRTAVLGAQRQMRTKKRSGLTRPALRGRLCRETPGFTLIELLVVIAIISLLVSILIPSLKRAKELTRRVICSSRGESPLRPAGLGRSARHLVPPYAWTVARITALASSGSLGQASITWASLSSGLSERGPSPVSRLASHGTLGRQVLLLASSVSP